MNEEQLAEQLADVGAQFSGSIDRDRAGVSLRTLSSEAERTVALATLAKIVQQPGFPEEIFQREKSRMIANVKQAGAEPSAIAERAFYKALYQDHPYAQTPTVATLSTLERTDMQRFYERYYRADQAVVSILGDLTRAQAEAVADLIAGARLVVIEGAGHLLNVEAPDAVAQRRQLATLFGSDPIGIVVVVPPRFERGVLGGHHDVDAGEAGTEHGSAGEGEAGAPAARRSIEFDAKLLRNYCAK